MRKANKKDNRFYTKLNQLNQRVDWYLLEGKFHKAVKLLLSIITICGKKHKKTHQGLAAYRLATVYLNVYSYEEAIRYYKLSLKCLDSPGEPMTKTVCEIYKGLYQCYMKRNDKDEALKYARLICEYTGLPSSEKAQYSLTIANILLKQYEETGQITNVIRGITYAKDALKLFERTNSQTIDYITALFTCGDMFFHLREYDQSLDFLQNAYLRAEEMDVFRTLLSRICFLMSRVYALKGDEEQSLFFRNRSLEFA